MRRWRSSAPGSPTPSAQRIEQATAALVADERRKAEELFRDILRRDASHGAALCGLAALSLAADVPHDAERLLRHALRQSAHLPLAYRGLGPALLALGRPAEAEAAARHLLNVEPENPQSWVTHRRGVLAFHAPGGGAGGLRARRAIQARRAAAAHFHRARAEDPRTTRRLRGILQVGARGGPANAEAWWSLADLKNYSFSDAELAAMESRVGEGVAERPGGAQLYFALGKALEQRRRYRDAFAAYAQGNALRRRECAVRHRQVRGTRRAHPRAASAANFSPRTRASGDPSRAPIFIVGLPRSGSTLIEQILASHSQVEGTMELPNILSHGA